MVASITAAYQADIYRCSLRLKYDSNEPERWFILIYDSRVIVDQGLSSNSQLTAHQFGSDERWYGIAEQQWSHDQLIPVERIHECSRLIATQSRVCS